MKAHPHHDFESCNECKSWSPTAAVTYPDNPLQANYDNYLSSDETMIGSDAVENDEVERFEVDLSERTTGGDDDEKCKPEVYSSIVIEQQEFSKQE